MLLAQICGLPINMPYTLADEIEELHEENLPTPTNSINMDEVYAIVSVPWITTMPW